MHKEKVNLDEIKLVGVSIRTNNSDEMNPEKSKITRGFLKIVHPTLDQGSICLKGSQSFTLSSQNYTKKILKTLQP